ncbi:hypothetical protein [Variovorax sp. SRS16]|uniref:hypothetical protein n=1 Tax=Variovorax sp. SRS16 TaxID=282217 RepID=UPI0013A567BA|nr:hypothetical protein [Variovorax sp. SRS16]
MKTSSIETGSSHGLYILSYRSVHDQERVLMFPCDSKGTVLLDDLSDRQFNNYLFARGMVGFEFDPPQVMRRGELH